MANDPNGLDRAGHQPDDPLLQRFLARDPAILEWVERVVTRIVRLRGYGIPVADRGDIAQETLLQIWREARSAGFVFRQDFAAFACLIASRRCIDWRRRRRNETPLDPSMPDPREGPDGTVLAAERRDLASRVLAEMRDACRELIRLRVIEGLAYGEIAPRLGRSEGALRTATWQCLKEARDHLRRIDPGFGITRSSWSMS